MSNVKPEEKGGFAATLHNTLEAEQWLFLEEQIKSENKLQRKKGMQLTPESLHYAALLFVHFVDVVDAARSIEREEELRYVLVRRLSNVKSTSSQVTDRFQRLSLTTNTTQRFDAKLKGMFF